MKNTCLQQWLIWGSGQMSISANGLHLKHHLTPWWTIACLCVHLIQRAFSSVDLRTFFLLC